MEVTVKNKTFSLRYSLRIYMVFESMVNRMFNPQLSGDVVMLFFAAVMSSNPECNLTFDELIDLVDDDPSLLDEFVSWYTSQIKVSEAKKKKKKKANL